MKNFTFVTLLALTFLTFPSFCQEPHGSGHVSTYELLPGQTLNLTNREFHWVELRSEYPVQFLAGPTCHTDSTVQWRCHFDDPADLFIHDLRVPPIIKQPKANTVTITFWED